MSKIKLQLWLYSLTIIFAIYAGNAHSQTHEYKEYTVAKGDTLWSIASQELSDPFLWPKIWKENPDIKKADILFPGHKLRIPVYLIQKESVPEPDKNLTALPEVKGTKELTASTKITPVEKQTLVDKNTLIAAGYISDAINSKGKITASPKENTLFGHDEYVYIETTLPAAKDDKFYIIRPLGKVKHPETNKFMGYLIDIVGIAKAIETEGKHAKIRIIQSFSEILIGDLVTDYYEIEPPFLIGKPRTPDVDGFIIAVKQQRILNSQPDIVYIDKGLKDGIETGDLLKTASSAEYYIPNGILQIIDARENTSTAIIRKCEKEVAVGDKIGSAAESQ